MTDAVPTPDWDPAAWSQAFGDINRALDTLPLHLQEDVMSISLAIMARQTEERGDFRRVIGNVNRDAHAMLALFRACAAETEGDERGRQRALAEMERWRR
jgi:hypothetical protein